MGKEWKEKMAELIEEEQAELKALGKVVNALAKYADRDNWGYYDESGCPKGIGSSTDSCFIGPEIAEEALDELADRMEVYHDGD